MDSSDFSSGDISGSQHFKSSGSVRLSHTLANDNKTEGPETINIKLFSDPSHRNQIGKTANVSVYDTSIDTKTYTLSTSTTSVNEGDKFNLYIKPSNLTSER